MRSKWKGAYCSPQIKEELINSKELGTKQKPYTIYSRESTILPEFIGKFVNIHNGYKGEWKNLEIKHLHVGYKFGEFAITKKSPRYKMKFKK